MLSTGNHRIPAQIGSRGRLAAAVFARPDFALRRARPGDLSTVNALIGRAIGSWGLPERVKRIGLPLYLYHAGDLGFLQITVAEDTDGNILGVAAWEPADPKDAPGGCRALLLHGLYVDPRWHRRGIGSQLLAAAVQAAANASYEGLLAKAQADAIPFFEAIGLEKLEIENAASDYPHRFWTPTRSA